MSSFRSLGWIVSDLTHLGPLILPVCFTTSCTDLLNWGTASRVVHEEDSSMGTSPSSSTANTHEKKHWFPARLPPTPPPPRVSLSINWSSVALQTFWQVPCSWRRGLCYFYVSCKLLLSLFLVLLYCVFILNFIEFMVLSFCFISTPTFLGWLLALHSLCLALPASSGSIISVKGI